MNQHFLFDYWNKIKQAEALNWIEMNMGKLAAGVLIGLIVIYLMKIWLSYGYFKKRGIKTPEYSFISGNFREIKNGVFSDVLRNWTKQLGKTYGYFEGHLPILVTSDLEIIQDVFIKKHDHFMARKTPPFILSDDGPTVNLIFASKARWKRMRNIMNTTFTPSKLKELQPIIYKSTQRLIEKIEQNLNKEIDVTRSFGLYTMDVIWNSAFGMDIDCQRKPIDSIVKKALRFFSFLNEVNLVLLAGIYFYELRILYVPIVAFFSSLLSKVNDSFGIPFFFLTQRIYKILDKRLQTKVYKKDYLQILIDSQTEEKKISQDNEQTSRLNEIHIEKKLTDDEIKMNVLLFLVAGFDTTSNALSLCMYVLAKHPHELAKLQEEIDATFAPDEITTYDNIQKLKYMDLFVKEVLRMYPLGDSIVNRRCTEATSIKGIDMPVNSVVTIDVLSLHYDPDLWGPEDPNNFYPSRFLPECNRNSLAYMPFGLGPRQCLGIRFALLEIKITLTNILRKFNVEPSPNTPEKMTFTETIAVRMPRHGVPVIFTRRLANEISVSKDKNIKMN